MRLKMPDKKYNFNFLFFSDSAMQIKLKTKADIKEGKVHTHDEVKEKMSKWSDK